MKITAEQKKEMDAGRKAFNQTFKGYHWDKLVWWPKIIQQIFKR
jgi:hypothetical protein